MKRIASFSLAVVLAFVLGLSGCAAVSSVLHKLALHMPSPDTYATASPEPSLPPPTQPSMTTDATVPLQTAEPTPQPTITPKPLPALNAQDQQALDYFLKIALNSEYHGEGSQGLLKRWENPIYISILGKCTKDDLKFIDNFVTQLSAVKGLPTIAMLDKNGKDAAGNKRSANFIIHYAPLGELPDICEGYVSGNWSYVTLFHNAVTYGIKKVVCGIASDKTTQAQRNHLTLSSITDGMGLLQDTHDYNDSIFYDQWTNIVRLSDLDWKLVQMLYSPAVKSGMETEEAKANLTRWLAATSIAK